MRMPRKPGDYVRVHEGRVQQWMAPVSLDAVWPLIAAIADRPPLAWLATFRPPSDDERPTMDARASMANPVAVFLGVSVLRCFFCDVLLGAGPTPVTHHTVSYRQTENGNADEP